MNSTDISIPWMNSTEFNYVYVASEVTVGFLAIIGNALVLLSFIRVKSLQTPRNFYIISLATADEFFGVVNVPLSIVMSIGLPKHRIGCLLGLSILDIPLYASNFSLLVISLDRLWAIAWPYSYQKRHRKRMAIGICIGAWVLAIWLAHLPLMGWYNHDGWQQSQQCFFRMVHDKYLLLLSHGVFSFISLGAMIVINVYLYRNIKKHERFEKMKAPASRRESGPPRPTLLCNLVYMKLMFDTKHAINLGKIVVAFVICQIPIASIFLVRAFASDATIDKIPKNLSTYATVFFHFNSVINPVMYAYHLMEFRVAMKLTFLSFFKCKH